METISVIIPVYNVEKYLKKCIDSIVNQTYNKLEIILVDDGSTDNSGKICDEYAKKDKRIKVIHKENGGLSDARNAGIEIATGEYIGFVDGDDYIAEDMYELLYNNLIKERVQLSCCNKFMVYKNKIISYGKSDYFKKLDSEEAIQLMCIGGYIDFSAYTKLYKKELFEDIRYPKGKLHEDIYTTHKLLDKAKNIIYDSTPKYFYRQRKGSITKGKKFNMDVIDASKKLIEFVENKYPLIKNSSIQNYLYALLETYNKIILNYNKKDLNKEKNFIFNEIRTYYPYMKKYNSMPNMKKCQIILLLKFPLVYKVLMKLIVKKRSRNLD